MANRIKVVHSPSPEQQYQNLLKKGRWFRVFKTNSHEIACVLAFSPMQACLWLAQNSVQKEDANSYAMGMMHASLVNSSVSRRIIPQ